MVLQKNRVVNRTRSLVVVGLGIISASVLGLAYNNDEGWNKDKENVLVIHVNLHCVQKKAVSITRYFLGWGGTYRECQRSRG